MSEMARTPFKLRIRSGPPAVGTLVTLSSPEVAEALSLTGLDWLFIDMEHGALDIGACQGLVRAAHDCLTLVRVPENSATWIRRVLDTGCDGVIIPLVCSAADVRRAVDAAKYPPEGSRSVGVARAHGYGLQFGQYVAAANTQVSVIVQIEHRAAVENLEEILTVDGIDAILIGPYDLSGSHHRLGDVSHPEVQAALDRVRRACRDRDMPYGIFVLSPQAMAAELEKGASFLAVGTDLSLMTGAAAEIRQLMPEVAPPFGS
jgi:2-keto-3-deoxy-L-rhamnonate aldolase RhmA